MISPIFTAILHQEDDLYVAQCPEVGTAKGFYANGVQSLLCQPAAQGKP